MPRQGVSSTEFCRQITAAHVPVLIKTNHKDQLNKLQKKYEYGFLLIFLIRFDPPKPLQNSTQIPAKHPQAPPNIPQNTRQTPPTTPK